MKTKLYTVYAVASSVFAGLAVFALTHNLWACLLGGAAVYWGLLSVAMAIKFERGG